MKTLLATAAVLLFCLCSLGADSIVDTERVMLSLSDGESVQGYVPSDWKVGRVLLYDHRPAQLPIFTQYAHFWPSACASSTRGGVDPLDDDDPCSTEALCQATATEICQEATGQGVLTDIAADVPHIQPHPSNRNCVVCRWECAAGGAAITTCCYNADEGSGGFDTQTIIDEPNPTSVRNPIPLCASGDETCGD